MSKIVYSCSTKVNQNYVGYTTNDVILTRQFFEWRYGQYSRIDKNEIIQEMLYNRKKRSIKEIWLKAEEFLNLAESEQCKTYFSNVARKYRYKYIYSL